MKPVPIVVAIVSLGIAFGAISWFTRVSDPVTPTEAKVTVEEPKKDSKKENPFEIPETGPYPKAVLEEETHEFGSMELGQTLSHPYVVRNEGEAPLLLDLKAVQCKCTVPTVPKDPIPPGESVEIMLEWKPEVAAEEFHQMAQIWTNDPENPLLELHVKGAVDRLFYLRPASDWQVNRLNPDDPIEFTGSIVSGIEDEFKIIDYSASTDLIQAEFVPLTPEELEEERVKSGYRVKGTLSGDTPIGKFRETLTMVTDLAENHKVAVHVTGFFPGPFSILGKDWIGSEMLLKLGHIKASEGKSVTLSMFVPREEEPMQVEVQETDPDFLDMTVVRDESFDVPSRERYLLTFTVPPGSPVGSWQGTNVATISATTNRESAPAFELNVEMTVSD